MSLREFLTLFLVCLIWGLHFLVMKVTVGAGADGQSIAPPLFYAALRMVLVAILLLPKLKWHRGKMKYIFAAGLGYGALNYAFMFPALEYAPASVAAVGIELYVPFSIILAAIFLKERIGPFKILGITLAFCGVAVMGILKPESAGAATDISGQAFVIGLTLIALAGLSEAFGALFVKFIKDVGPLQLLAWFAVIGAPILSGLSLILEDNQMDSFAPENRAAFSMALAYSVLLVSLVAHASYYWLLGRLPMYIVSTGGLMTTLIAVTASVLILKEPLSMPLVIGGAMTIAGVGLILLRGKNRKAGAQVPAGISG